MAKDGSMTSLNSSDIKNSKTERAFNIDKMVQPFLESVKDLSQSDYGNFDFLKANQIGTEFIRKLTPYVYMNNFLRELWNWKSPTHTLIFGISNTVVILFPEYAFCLALLFLYYNSSYVASILIKLGKSLPKEKLERENLGSIVDKNKKKFNRYKANMAFIQVMF